MPNITGSFVGRANSQTLMALEDVPNHELSLVEISGPQTASDPLWNGAAVSYWGMADLVSGSGTQKGYSSTSMPMATLIKAHSNALSRPPAA
jgi:hypothetical protein